jgi:glutamine amidotransferase
MSTKKVAIIDYGMGNLNSVKISLNYLGVKNDLISNPKYIKKYSHIILPGVGSFKKAIKNLRNNGMFQSLKEISNQKKCKILGICLGMQLLFNSSTEEGTTKGLGILNGKVEKFSLKKTRGLKIPHVGFNEVFFDQKNSFFRGIKNNSDFYFDHSYRITEFEKLINPVLSIYGEKFLSGFNVDNVYGTQFHPEKSQSNGLTLLKNFINCNA